MVLTVPGILYAATPSLNAPNKPLYVTPTDQRTSEVKERLVESEPPSSPLKGLEAAELGYTLGKTVSSCSPSTCEETNTSRVAVIKGEYERSWRPSGARDSLGGYSGNRGSSDTALPLFPGLCLSLPEDSAC